MTVQVEQELARLVPPLGKKYAAQRQHVRFGNGRHLPGRRGRHGFVAPAQVLAQPAAQRACIDGFGDVTVATGIDGLLLVALHGESRQRHHHQVFQIRVFADAAGQLQAVHTRELDIGKHQVWMKTFQ